MAGENERYFRTKQDIARDLAIKEQNARTAAARQAQAEEMARQQQGFVQPGGNMSLAGITPGFDSSNGTGAGGMAYQQGIDFGTNIGVPGAGNYHPNAPAQVGYENEVAPEELEQYHLDEFYSGYSQLNTLGQQAARFGVDVNNPDPMDPEAMEISRQYHSMYNQLLEQGEMLQQGYQAQQTAQEKGQVIEDHYGTTQFTDAFDPTKYNEDVDQLNLQAKVMYTRGSRDEANNMLFGNSEGNVMDAYKNRTGRVGQYFNMADELDQQGKHQEARVIRQKMFDVLGAVYDSTKQQKLALDADEIARKKKKDEFDRFKHWKKQNKKNSVIADLSKQVYMLQNQGDLGFVKQFHPDAHYESDAGATYVVFDKKSPTGFGTETVRINVNDDTDIVAQFMEDNPDFIGVDMGEYQEFKQNFGGYQPTADENWQVKVNTEGYWDVVKAAQKNADATNVRKVADYLQPYLSLIQVNGQGVKSVTTENKYDNAGTDEIRLTLDDGSYVYYDMDDGGAGEISSILKTVNVDSAANYMKKHKYNPSTGTWTSDSHGSTIVDPNSDENKTNGVNWKKQPLFVRYRRDGEAADVGRSNGEEAWRRTTEQYDVENFAGSSPSNTNTTPNGQTDWSAYWTGKK